MRVKPNDELRHEWRLSLQHKRGLAESTVAAKLAALTDFENFTSGRSFLRLKREQVADFKEHLLTTKSEKTGERLSSSTLVHTLDHCRDFFTWLAATKNGSRLDVEAVSWFHAHLADQERARTTIPKSIPRLEDARKALAHMPAKTLIDRRNRAIFATLLMTAIRADALASLAIGSVDLEKSAVRQDAKIVRTKFSKSFVTYFLPFVTEARPILQAWLVELGRLGLSSNDALFPRDPELQDFGKHGHIFSGDCPRWKGSSQVRAIVREAFAAAGLVTHGPHVFRHMLTRHAISLRLTIEEAISVQINLGHKRLETMLNPYGRPDEEGRGALIANISRLPPSSDLTAFLERLARDRPDLAAQIMMELSK